MAAKSMRKQVSEILADQIPVDQEQWDKAMEDKKRSTAIQQPIAFDIMLAAIIRPFFPGRNKDVKKLMDGINMVQKARLAYLLELIDKKVYNDLEQIHGIRNKFGHRFDASFAQTKILKLVEKLSTAQGKEVTPKNSFKFYESASAKCVIHFITASRLKLEKAQKD